jgi:transcriptional regulator GlxA family with amidase domain
MHAAHAGLFAQAGLTGCRLQCPADSRMTQIGRAIRWIRDHYAATVRIEDLANIAGMSLTSFHRHFLGVTSLSPLQFQKQIRLQEARSRLLLSSQDVAAVGFAVGYDGPSQFSREYRRLQSDHRRYRATVYANIPIAPLRDSLTADDT